VCIRFSRHRLPALRGEPVIVYFGHAFCPDVRAIDLLTIMQAIEALGSKPKARRNLHLPCCNAPGSCDREQRSLEPSHDARFELYSCQTDFAGSEFTAPAG
jgi:hypothetical protein